MSIYVPRGGTQFHHHKTSDVDKSRTALANICLRIPHKGFEISISCDDSAGCCEDLVRSDIRVFKDNVDVTLDVMGNNTVYADAQTLKRALRRVDEITRGLP
jgi:elongation factor P hydroxylase